jgi:hypothetical protein
MMQTLFKTTDCYALSRQADRQLLAAQLTADLQASPSGLTLLQQAGEGGLILHESIQLLLLDVSMQSDSSQIRALVMFDELLGGCNCNDEPMPQARSVTLTLTLLPDQAVHYQSISD